MVRMWQPQGGGDLPALDRAAARPALGPPLAGSARSGGVSAPGPAVWGGAGAYGAGAARDPRRGAGTQLPCAAGLRAATRAAHAATSTPLPSRKRPTAPTQFPRGSQPTQRARTYQIGTAAEGGDGAGVWSGSDEGAAGCRPALLLRTARVWAGTQAPRGAREEEEAPPSPAQPLPLAATWGAGAGRGRSLLGGLLERPRPPLPPGAGRPGTLPKPANTRATSARLGLFPGLPVSLLPGGGGAGGWDTRSGEWGSRESSGSGSPGLSPLCPPLSLGSAAPPPPTNLLQVHLALAARQVTGSPTESSCQSLAASGPASLAALAEPRVGAP